MLRILNKRQFIKGLESAPKKMETMFAERIQKILAYAMNSLTSKTPVNSGKAVRNYVATTDIPYNGKILPAIASTRKEQTNDLPLGVESRRPANTAAAFATLKNITPKPHPFKKYFITNKAKNISGLEHGELPLPPFKPRSPNGMFAVTVQEIIARLQSGAL